MDMARHISQLIGMVEMVAISPCFQLQTTETIQQLRDHNALYRAQVKEMGSRLEQARRQGQEIAERKSSGEISVLREELGYKSK